MRFVWPVLLLLWPCATFAQSSSASAPVQTDVVDSKVYDLGGDVVAPRLKTPELPTVQGEVCNGRLRGKVVLDLVVDETGKPEQVYFINALGNDLDRLALVAVEADRFDPGTRNGDRVAVKESVDVSLDGCIEAKTDDSGKQVQMLRLKTQPLQTFSKFRSIHGAKFFKDAEPPYPLMTPEAQFTDEARNRRISGVCLIKLTIDEHGLTQNPTIVHTIGHGLDEEAIKAVQKYRFRPALKKGKPVAVAMTIEVNFRQ